MARSRRRALTPQIAKAPAKVPKALPPPKPWPRPQIPIPHLGGSSSLAKTPVRPKKHLSGLSIAFAARPDRTVALTMAAPTSWGLWDGDWNRGRVSQGRGRLPSYSDLRCQINLSKVSCDSWPLRGGAFCDSTGEVPPMSNAMIVRLLIGDPTFLRLAFHCRPPREW